MTDYSNSVADLHDAELVSIAIDRTNKAVKLGLQQANGALHNLELHGVKVFRSEDVTLQNVISRVLQSSRGHFLAEDLEIWLQWVTSLSDASSWLSDGRRREWCAACRSGNLELLMLEPSAGAQVVGLCERVVLS